MPQSKEETAAKRKIYAEKNKVEIAAKAAARNIACREAKHEKRATKSDRKAEVIANHGVEEWERRKALNNARNRKMNATPRKQEMAHQRYLKITPEETARNVATHLLWEQTPAGKRSKALGRWRFRGMIAPENTTLEEIYDTIYFPCTNCMVCKTEFKSTRDRHCDHSHVSGLYRQVLCGSCNNQDSWKNKI